MVFHTPLDLEYWLVSVFAGSTTIFVALSFVVIATLAAFFRMPNSIMLIMTFLYILIMSAYGGISYMGGLLFIAIIILGWILYWMLARAVK